jgi:hypothetical protein
MPATSTDLEYLLDEMEDHTPQSGTEALTNAWVALSHVPTTDALYGRCVAAQTVLDALIRTEG